MRRSLSARITAVTVLVAVVAVAVTGLVSLQLVRTSTIDNARDQVAAQADILARLPRLVSGTDLEDQASLALGGTLVALVMADGTVQGAAAAYVDTGIRTRLQSGENVSATRRADAGVAIVEARPTADGTAIVLALPLSGVDRALGRSTWRIVIALGIGLIVAVVGGILLGRRLSRPLSETAAAARRLAAGERGVAMPESPAAEMAAVTDALSALDRALEASEGRQREFLLSISHELRTPLTAVRGYAEALADGLISADKVADVGRVLGAETERIDRFVGDLLELARLEADEFSMTDSAVDLAQLTGEVAAAWQGRAAIVESSVTASGGGTVRADTQRLRQVLDGLVENALRAGGSVQLRADGDIVEVLDTGPGFAEEDLPAVFDRGVLRARYRDVRPVGTGLGLSIAARLVQRMGGTLTVANRLEGGAAFTVRLARS